MRDRISFMQFLGLGIEHAVPDEEILWLYREALDLPRGRSERQFYTDDGVYIDLNAPVCAAENKAAKVIKRRPEDPKFLITDVSASNISDTNNEDRIDGRRRDLIPVSLSPGVGFIFDKAIWAVETTDLIPAYSKCKGDSKNSTRVFYEAPVLPGKAYCSSCCSKYFVKPYRHVNKLTAYDATKSSAGAKQRSSCS